MLKFYYNPAYKYTNRTIIDLTGDSNYKEVNYLNIDTPDTINGHIIYILGKDESIPTYIYDTENTNRWFVSGITPLSARKKYQISLVRDIISENPIIWAAEQNSYISAGLATNYNKYKRWGLPFTNTKVGQQKLTINGNSSFYVFYVNEQNISGAGVLSESDLPISYASIPGISSFDYTVNGLNSIPGYEYVGVGTVYNLSNIQTKLNTVMRFSPNNYIKYIWDQNGDFQYTSYVPNYFYIATAAADVATNTNSAKTNMMTAVSNYTDTVKASLYGTSIISNSNINNLAPYIGKTILDSSTNKVYRISLNNSPSYTDTYDADRTSAATLVSALMNINWPSLDTTDTNNYTSNGTIYSFSANVTEYVYTIEELGTASSVEFTLKADVRKLPKSAVRCVNIVPTGSITKEEMAQALMMAQTNAGIDPDNPNAGRILDIQYLPFSVATSTNNNIKINNTAMTAQFLELDDFQYAINLADLTDMHKETDTIKIVSPSRASQFLFRPYDNDGNMEFGVKITIKPYTSTIYVRPSTKGLLMYDWDDKDALIIEEDFSLTTVTSQWTEYIYNNKTFLNSFERQIQGREFERGWERRVEEAQMRADDWTARNITAQKSATYSGNLPIISGIVGAVGMLAAGPDRDYMYAAQLDRQYNEAMYQESVSLSRDLFNYQLENIKSQPMVPSKITTIDCKFLDGIYLEFYSTNETELQAIANYYAFNGNRIDDYGSFATYWGPYVRGRIIKTNNYTQPEFEELNRRLTAGIFTGGYSLT